MFRICTMGSINYGIGRRYFSFYFKANSFTMVTFKSTFQEKCSCSMFIGLLNVLVPCSLDYLKSMLKITVVFTIWQFYVIYVFIYLYVIFFLFIQTKSVSIPYYFEDDCKCTMCTSRLSWLGSEGGRATGCVWKEQLCFSILVIQERWGVLFSNYTLYDFDFLTFIFEYWFYRILLQNCIKNQMIRAAGLLKSLFSCSCFIDYMYVGWFLKKKAFLYYDISAMPKVYRFRATQQWPCFEE